MLISVVDLLAFFVITLAVMRVTRLIVWDKITLPVRVALVSGITRKGKVVWKGLGDQSKIVYLVHCIYCTGFWISVTLPVPYLIWPHSKVVFAGYLLLAIAEAAPRLLAYDPATGGR